MQKGGRVSHLALDIQKQCTETIKVTERPTGIPFVCSTDFAHNILMPKYREHDKFGNIKAYIHIYICFYYIKQNRGKNSHNGKCLILTMDDLTVLSKLTMYNAGNSLSESTWNFILTLLKLLQPFT